MSISSHVDRKVEVEVRLPCFFVVLIRFEQNNGRAYDMLACVAATSMYFSASSETSPSSLCECVKTGLLSGHLAFQSGTADKKKNENKKQERLDLITPIKLH